MATSKILLGPIPHARYDWVSGASYGKEAIVFHKGSSYIALSDNPSAEPSFTYDPATGSYNVSAGWGLLAVGAAAEQEAMIERLKFLLGFNADRSTVTLEVGESGKYVKCESRSAVANSAFAISKPFAVDACSELFIKTGFNPSDSAHASLDLSIIATISKRLHI